MSGLRTHCRKGHPLTGGNVLTSASGAARRCARCRQASRGAGVARQRLRAQGAVQRWLWFVGLIGVGFVGGLLLR